MYTSTLKQLSQKPSFHPVQDDGDLHFGLRLYKDDEVFSVGVDDTRNMWNILVFMSGAYTPDMGYKESGVYVAPVIDFQDGSSLGDHFKGFLLSIPFSFWRVFDIYNLERHFMSFHFRPFVELDHKEVQSLCLLMSLMESPVTDGDIPNDDMVLIHLYRAFIATLNRYFGLQEYPHEAHTTGNRYVDGFLSLVENHCLKEKSLDFYARQLGTTPKYLSMTISRTTGKKAGKWISESVIEITNKLLSSTSSQINEIAGKVGFASSSDFCRYYKACTGITPMQYRKEYLKKRMR